MFKLFRKLTERSWPEFITGPVSIDATSGIVTVPDTRYLSVKQKIKFEQVGQEALELEVMRVLSATQFTVQQLGGKFTKVEIVPAAYNGGNIRCTNAQRNEIGGDIVTRNVYAEEPAIALRTLGVSHLGTPLDTPDGQLETMEPVAVFTYGPSFEVLLIREFSPDAQVGDYCRQTAFTYGPSLEVLKIITTSSLVTSGDLSV